MPTLNPCDYCGSLACERDTSGTLLGCEDCGFDLADTEVVESAFSNLPPYLVEVKEIEGDPEASHVSWWRIVHQSSDPRAASVAFRQCLARYECRLTVPKGSEYFQTRD